ncbi:CPSF metallobeta-lactamase [Cryptosporidium ubiquitum]|uniref:CPSF metallobeta-lactamase n=1 Tax=Cryptosporidium ubiquitum TaxID=857276 RepID=A0A1J4MEP4_9CRYT|nr:CPSF metallobeta-lactamase [Cryptosporidium ubiquitum]OII71333.1 CPSF metallobeta-lactamase [Cryptosporidium ubiquitum]
MTISIIPLGAGQDVGRSCILTKIGSKTVMFDCGMHMGFKDERKYPDFKAISATLDPLIINDYIDLVIISHYHLDHCGALPFFTEKIGYTGPIVMTYPTKSVSSVLLSDCCKIMEQKLLLQRTNNDVALATNEVISNSEYGFFTVSDVWSCMEKVKAIQLHQTIVVSGIKITPYYAGHVLGASMFHIQVNDESIVYTGDFNMVRDRHLGPALIPKLLPSLLISESTYATYIRPSRRSTERTFCEMVYSCLKRGGKVLIPVFAIGRAQELCILLEIYWRRMQIRFPIFFGGSMTEKANSYYQLFTNWTNTPLADNIFTFPHVMPYDKSILTLSGPAVLFATPGMLNTGLSLQAFKMWAPDSNNLTIIPGFCVSGTIGSKIINGAKRVFIDQKDPSTCIEVRCNVKYLSFSSHADSIGIQSLISHSEPQAIAFVHGEKQGMLSLASFINYELKIPSFCPHNGSITSLPTKGKNKYLCYLSIKFSLAHAVNPLQNLTERQLEVRNIIEELKKQQINNSFAFLFGKYVLSISQIHSLIIEYYATPQLFPIYVFTSKYINRGYSFVLTKNELYIYIKGTYKTLQKKIMKVKIQPKKNKTICETDNSIYQDKILQIKSSLHKTNYFNLLFYFEIYNIEIVKLLTAILNLVNIISKQFIKKKNCNLIKHCFKDLTINNKLMKSYFYDDFAIITYKSLIAKINAESYQIDIIKNFFSSLIKGKPSFDLKKSTVSKIAISWSFIDNKSIEISDFINILEKN